MKKQNVFKRAWHYLQDYRGSVYLALFFTIFAAVMNVLEPFVLGLIMTEITNNVAAMVQGVEGAGLNYPYILMWLIIYFVRGFLWQVTSYGSNVHIANAVQSAIHDMRRDLSAKLNRLPVSYVDGHPFGDLLGRLTSDVESVSNALQQSILQIFNAILSIVLVIIMMLILNPLLGLIIFISMPLSYFVSKAIVKRSQPYFKRQATILGDLNAYVQENLSGFNVIKLYGREETARQDFQAITEDLAQTGFKASFISSLMMPLVSVVSHITYLLLAVFGGRMVIQGILTIGNLQAFVQYVWQVNQPIQTITQLSGPLQSAKAALDRIFEILDEKEEAVTQTRELGENLTGQVSFENVSFQYKADEPLIQNFNVEVNPGEMVAIVGPTGAGKTTMINLLMRFYDVTGGAIKVDGIDIRDLPRQAYRQQFGMVLQDAWLYEATIKENLRFGNLDATDEEIIAAAKAANVDHFIRTLPGGYNMVMNQESSNISLGQKQLLTIARALLSNPKILILDEATSSVDTRLEQLIQKAMSRLMKGRTSFVIAHRLSTIQEADRILVMKEGQIIEQGTHDSLLEQGGFYYELYQSQFAK
ncbi:MULTISPECIES: ABC transporter ATP-binding protein [unclassified Facklamia]|uniref:ABC transporter ATP-binding protein n=1 Tax=Aerococcaceae TaxID=186827 RepID=UPI0013BAF49D|nr:MULTISPECIES: ABC transporter ATP-binding protein [unclassified Facklamia]NEW65198.1 ATP-binding cassette domain-containing protein [Facklamia sp. 252]NEW68589.1 ATP-binding cassette domain-containing protein [Facklamia sp. 253]QQD66001.1 ABC transporter ATP-binding protein [Aerococcaceae bacterium zg-252]